MKILSLHILLLLLAFTACKEKIGKTEQVQKSVQLTDFTDQAILNSIKEISKEQSFFTLEKGDRIVELAKIFLQTPYVGGTLESAGEEALVVNLRELDCTTYLENVVVFSRITENKEFTKKDFLKNLEQFRYRNGKLTDYSSRLHYFSDWIFENEKKGLVKNMTSEIGGDRYEKEINFMSNHVSAYSALKVDSSLIVSIKNTEDAINEREMYYIAEEKIQALEKKIKDGDLIAITTNIKGLDISHVGIAIHENDRLHLMHASSLAKKVVISDIPLTDILKASKLQSGIMVSRVK
jgi:hypothetical protein